MMIARYSEMLLPCRIESICWPRDKHWAIPNRLAACTSPSIWRAHASGGHEQHPPTKSRPSKRVLLKLAHRSATSDLARVLQSGRAAMKQPSPARRHSRCLRVEAQGQTPRNLNTRACTAKKHAVTAMIVEKGRRFLHRYSSLVFIIFGACQLVKHRSVWHPASK
ncbi:unnamed protein product [Periconia digitata]|uniref:Uncharacterized protein n=1 Tax=Periconia digitata TaxID=1303443 RepID=A0A9W4XJI7_9PLEO|nr:unnamed protein product [Periconia digitata]